MKIRALAIIGLVMMEVGCAAKQETRSAPDLSSGEPVGAAEEKPQRDVLKEVGDTTWKVVTGPVRLVVPEKREKAEPEVYEAPSAVIMTREGGEE
jgi:hypothetical protein